MRIIDFHTHCYTDALAERAMLSCPRAAASPITTTGRCAVWCKPRPKRASSFRS